MVYIAEGININSNVSSPGIKGLWLQEISVNDLEVIIRKVYGALPSLNRVLARVSCYVEY